MKKLSLNDYIVEQILVLEQRQLLEENKILKGLSAAGLAAAIYFASGFLQSDKITADDVANTAKQGHNLSAEELSQIKDGADAAKEMLLRGTKPEVIIKNKDDPGIATAFKALFNNTKSGDIDSEGNPVPFASADDVNLDEIFFYTQEQLNGYFNIEANRQILTLDDGTCLLDMSSNELNEEISDQTSESTKRIAEEILNSSIVAHEATDAIIDAFSNNSEDTYEDNMDIAEIKAQFDSEMLRANALKAWLKKNVKNTAAKFVIDDITSAAGSISNSSEAETWIDRFNAGDALNDRGEFVSDFEEDDYEEISSDEDTVDQKRRRNSVEDYEEIADFLEN